LKNEFHVDNNISGSIPLPALCIDRNNQSEKRGQEIIKYIGLFTEKGQITEK
jgi:hypothetical protein